MKECHTHATQTQRDRQEHIGDTGEGENTEKYEDKTKVRARTVTLISCKSFSCDSVSSYFQCSSFDEFYDFLGD